MTERDPAAVAALALAGVAVLLAGYAAVRAPAPAGPDPALIERLGALEHRVQAAEQLAVRSAARSIASPGVPPDLAPPAEGAAPDPYRATPRFAELRAEASGVTVRQEETGGLSVVNTDPELTGQVIFVVGVHPDGTETQVPITVPPPE